MPPLRVVLADDHNLVRAGFRSLLENLPDVQVVAEASDGLAAFDLIARHQPHLAILDIAMPGLNGLELAERVAHEFPHVRVILLSMYGTQEHILRALRAGAVGFVSKEADIAELELAVAAVARGEIYLSPGVSTHVAEYVRAMVDAPTSSLELLTPRQRQVLQLIAEGHTTQGIAHALGISAKTAETHRANLMERLDIHDIAGLVRYAIRVGLVVVDG
jgi:DNA-binding NarL/FixJ family response regulator